MAAAQRLLFLSTPSARRATRPAQKAADRPRISIHALREEGDCSVQHELHLLAYFYPRPPRGGRREPESRFCCCRKFLSTPSARRATTKNQPFCPKKLFLSTPSARRATSGAAWQQRSGCYFYPRPPRGGRRTTRAKNTSKRLFLSTPSARRATAKTETKSLFSNKLYNILHEFRRALIYNGSKNYPNHAK